MLSQPILLDPDYPKTLDEEMEKFICHIFDQPVEEAYRRSRVYLPKDYDNYLARAVDPESLTVKNLLMQIKTKVIKKIRRVCNTHF